MPWPRVVAACSSAQREVAVRRTFVQLDVNRHRPPFISDVLGVNEADGVVAIGTGTIPVLPGSYRTMQDSCSADEKYVRP